MPLSDYRLPGLPAGSAAMNAWVTLQRIIKPVDEQAQTPVKREADLRALEQVRLEHLVPPIDWSIPAIELETARSKPGRTGSVAYLVGPPHGGHADILRHLGERLGAPTVAPPSSEQILDGGQSWFEEWPEPPWVLPNLERCYLRHVRGLPLIRHLFEEVERERLGQGIIGCDSWAWAYLQHVYPLPRPDVLTLQSFDGPRLARLLSAMVPAGRAVRFRNATTGNDILNVPPTDTAVRSEIVQLAAHCRGNVGVAVRYWRERLRAEPESEAPGVREDEPSEQSTSEEESVWVSAELPEPVLPIETDEDTALVLHALLVHGGLGEAVLPDLLPLSRHRCISLLLRLRRAGLVHEIGDYWHIPALAYASVRRLLRARDYLTDDF